MRRYLTSSRSRNGCAFAASVFFHALALLLMALVYPRDAEVLSSAVLAVSLAGGTVPQTAPARDTQNTAPRSVPAPQLPDATHRAAPESAQAADASVPQDEAPAPTELGEPAAAEFGNEANADGAGTSAQDGSGAGEQTITSFSTLTDGAVLPLPEYPALARKWGYEGEVLVRMTICSDGSVADIVIVRSSGYPILDTAVVKTVSSKWRFAARPSSVATEKIFEFRLRKQ